MNYRQQGDVLFKPVANIPKECKAINTNVVQEGELTGHAHRLYDGDFEILQHPETKQKFLRIVKETEIRHEEHKAFKLPPGEYYIDIVREVDHFEKLTRQVAD